MWHDSEIHKAGVTGSIGNKFIYENNWFNRRCLIEIIAPSTSIRLNLEMSRIKLFSQRRCRRPCIAYKIRSLNREGERRLYLIPYYLMNVYSSQSSFPHIINIGEGIHWIWILHRKLPRIIRETLLLRRLIRVNWINWDLV